MLRKRKKQLRYAADQIIPNPRRRSEAGDDSQRDVVHLKRRDEIEARRERPHKNSQSSSRLKSESTTPAADESDDGLTAQDRSEQSVDVNEEPVKVENDDSQVMRSDRSKSPLSQVVDAPELELVEFENDANTGVSAIGPKLPHPDDATPEFDELDELLLAEEDEELERAIRRRLRSQRESEQDKPAKATPPSGDVSRADDGSVEAQKELTNQRLVQLEKEREQAQQEVEQLREIASKAQHDRERIQQQAENDRHLVEQARKEQAQIRKSAEQDRLLAERARKEQVEIRERAEKERAALKETIEEIRQKSLKAEAERLAIVESIEKERSELANKLERERDLARQAEEQRQGMLRKTEQQRKEVRAAMEKQQGEARRLAEEAARLEQEARTLEKERQDIVLKAQRERTEAENLLAKEREQVRLVGEQWAEIQQRASSEREKIRKLVDTDSPAISATQLRTDDGAITQPPSPPMVSPTRPGSIDEPPQRSAARTAAEQKTLELARQEKLERSLREQALQEQKQKQYSSDKSDRVDDEVDRKLTKKADDSIDDDGPSLARPIVEAKSADVRGGRSPRPNRFTDNSGTGESVEGFSFTQQTGDSDAGTESRSQTRQSAQTDRPPEQDSAVAKGVTTGAASSSQSASAAGKESIPVLESSGSAQIRPRSSRSSFFEADGFRSMALAAAVFVVVLIGSSAAFFGYLNLDTWIDRETAAEMNSRNDDGLLTRIGRQFVDARNRIFGDKPGSDQPGSDQQISDGQQVVAVAQDADTPMLAENAPSTDAIEPPPATNEQTQVAASAATDAIAADVILGRVVSNTGDAVAGLTITALARKYFVDPKGSSGGVNYRTRTDEDGNFSLRVPPGEEYRVVSEGTDQYAPVSARLAPGGDYFEMELEPLNGDLSVTGRIFTDSLDPIASARATTQFEPIQEVYSDDDGVYSIKVRRPTGGSDDTLVLRFEASGYHDGIMHLPANVWKAGKSISHDVFLDAL